MNELTTMSRADNFHSRLLCLVVFFTIFVLLIAPWFTSMSSFIYSITRDLVSSLQLNALNNNKNFNCNKTKLFKSQLFNSNDK